MACVLVVLLFVVAVSAFSAAMAKAAMWSFVFKLVLLAAFVLAIRWIWRLIRPER